MHLFQCAFKVKKRGLYRDFLPELGKRFWKEKEKDKKEMVNKKENWKNDKRKHLDWHYDREQEIGIERQNGIMDIMK